MYNYKLAVTADVQRCFYQRTDLHIWKNLSNRTREEFEELFYQELIDRDDVTGNGRYGYFSNENDAKRALEGNEDMLQWATDYYTNLVCYGLYETPMQKDSTIRCYLLRGAIINVVADYLGDDYLAE